jgi:tetratricopeptide (TPR) repeat protein
MNSFALLTHKLPDQSLTHKRSDEDKEIVKPHQGKDEQAEPLLVRALAIREQQLEPDHPDTAQSMWWLAVLSEQQQHYEQAASLYQRALTVFEHVLGPHHPRTRELRTQYASLLRTMGRDAGATALDQP